MRINHNISALNAYRNLAANNANTAKSLEKLSSGLRINRAADDAAGLAISEKMRSQIRGLDMAGRNALDGISLIQTAEGALSSTHEILQRMRELAVQAANDSNTQDDRNEIQKEVNQLTSELNRIGSSTEFNTKKLLNGTMGVVNDAKEINNEALNGTLSNLQIDPLSSLDNGKYEIDFTTPNVAELMYDDGGGGGYASLSPSKTQNFTTDGDTVNFGDIGLSFKTINTTTSTSATFDVGTAPADLSANLQIGANAGQTVVLSISDMGAKALSVSTDVPNGGKQTITMLDGSSKDVWYTDVPGSTDGISNDSTQYAVDVTSNEKAQAAISLFDDAIQKVSSERAHLGAIQNRLEYTVSNLSSMNENVTAAESRVRDLDMAKEMTEFTKNNILNQAAQSMLAQANQLPQGVLQLLK